MANHLLHDQHFLHLGQLLVPRLHYKETVSLLEIVFSRLFAWLRREITLSALLRRNSDYAPKAWCFVEILQFKWESSSILAKKKGQTNVDHIIA